VKLVRDSILIEKFIQDSDPIADMGIGMKHLIKKWVETETDHDYNEEDLLWICAEYGKTKFVKYLLDAGAHVHVNNDNALQWASYNGHTDIVKLLLDAGADVHADNDGALRTASCNGHTDVVKLLLDAGADVHAYNDNALRLANNYGHTDVVKILKDHIAKEKKNKVVRESLSEKFVEDSDPIADMGIGMKAQLKKWVETETRYNYIEKDLLWICAEARKTKFVKYLLDAGADVHADDDYALRWASGKGHADVVKLLLDAGADVHAGNDYALRWASKNGHTDIVKLLLDAGANVHARDNGALQGATYYGHSDVVKILKDHIAKEKKNKVVKESLSEKFVEDSDPISDMRIGLYIKLISNNNMNK